MAVTIDDIRDAARQLENQVVRTPTLPSLALSELIGVDIVLKLENLQVTGSFKSRGAFIKLSGLSDGQKKPVLSRRPPATTPRALPIMPAIWVSR